jgi:Holliday junction resolvase RusA-like endonuclease
MYKLEFEINGLPKRINQSYNKHWYCRKEEADKWLKYVSLIITGKKPPNPLLKARLTLIRHSSVCPDSDGLVSSFKHVIDALRKSGVIVDDKFQNVGMPTYLWELAKRGQGKIVVKVEEVL